MPAKWILLFALSFSTIRGFSQLNEHRHNGVQWRGLGFLQGSGYVNGVSENCGIYSTARDRESGILSMAIDCQAEEHRMKPGFIRDRAAIKIVRNEKSYNYLRQDIYGYRDCQGREFHFFDGKSYELVNPGESIPIYRVFEQKGKQRVTKLFFGSDSARPKPLTIENLRREFSDEPLFLQKLNLLARNDFELARYFYLINRLLRNTSEGV